MQKLDLSTKQANLFCSVEDIKRLNETKRYTLISSDVLTKVLTDCRLTVGAAKLWQFLYSKANLHPKLEIKVSHRDIATIFSKSTRTISRYINSLNLNGYIEIVNNFTTNGQSVNTYKIRLPCTIIKEVKRVKNRVKHLTSINKIKHASRLIKEQTIIDSELKYSEKQLVNNSDKPSNNSSLNSLYQEMQIKMNKKEDISELYEKIRQLHALEATREVLQNKINMSRNDKNVYAGHDINDRHKTNNINMLLNNNEPSLPTAEILNSIVLRRSNIVNFEYVRNKYQRKVPNLQIDKIIKVLNLLGMNGQTNQTLTEQIIFEVENGSLKYKPVNHAINIALKLVKTKRWTTPCGMRLKMM